MNAHCDLWLAASLNSPDYIPQASTQMQAQMKKPREAARGFVGSDTCWFYIRLATFSQFTRLSRKLAR